MRPYLKGTRFTIQNDHEALRKIPSRAETIAKLARWCLRLSTFELDMVHRAGIKHEAAKALSHIKIIGGHKTSLDDEVVVLNISQEIFTYTPRTETTDFKSIGEIKGSFVPFIQVVCMMESITDNHKAKIPTLAEFILAKSTNEDYCSAFASAGKLNTCSNVDSDGVLVRVFLLEGASQRVLPASLRPCFRHLYRYSLFAGHPVERRMYASMIKKLSWPIWPMMSTLLCGTTAPAHRTTRMASAKVR